jgi:hypothetical protein
MGALYDALSHELGLWVSDQGTNHTILKGTVC